MSRCAAALLAAALAPPGAAPTVTIDQTSTAPDGTVTLKLTVTVPPGQPAPKNERFVSVSGSDTTGNGTAAQPYATPVRALVGAPAGTTITLTSGSYPGGFTVNQTDITLRGAPNASVTLSLPTTDASKVNTLWFMAPGGKVENLEITGGYYFGLKFEKGPGTVTGCRIHDVGVCGIKIVPGAHDVTVTNTEVYRTGRRTTANSQGIDCVGGDRLRVSDCTFREVTDMAVCAKGGSRGSVIERCRITDCWIGAQLGQVTDLNFIDATNNPELYENVDGIIRNCLIQRCRYAGIGLWAALRPQVIGNTILLGANEGQGALHLNTGDRASAPNGLLGNKDAVIADNVVTVPADARQGAAPLVQIQPGAVVGTLTLDHNRYWANGQPTRFLDIRSYPAKPIDYVGPFPGWVTYTKSEAGSSEGDPGLDSAGKPTRTSAVRAAGRKSVLLPDDLEKKARPDVPAIGSLEPAP